MLDLRIHSHWKERNNHPENYWGGKDEGPSWPSGKGGGKKMGGQEEGREGRQPPEPHSHLQCPIQSNLYRKAVC